MAQRPSQPVALTIAGSDSGGEAGVQADLKTFSALGVHGACVITALTAQNARGVRAIQATSPRLVNAQLEAVFEAFSPAAVKTGMLPTPEVIRAVARGLRRLRPAHLVLDPVLAATSGARLMSRAGWEVLQRELLPLATLITPNLAEAEALTGLRLREVEDLRRAARLIHALHGCAVWMKGGHLPALREAVDIFWDGREELLLQAPRVRGLKTHGTGCTGASAVAAFLAHGHALPEAVKLAKQYLTNALARSVRVQGRTVLDWQAR